MYIFCKITSWCGKICKLISYFITEQTGGAFYIKCAFIVASSHVAGVYVCVCGGGCTHEKHFRWMNTLMCNSVSVSGTWCYIASYCRGKKHNCESVKLWPAILSVCVWHFHTVMLLCSRCLPEGSIHSKNKLQSEKWPLLVLIFIRPGFEMSEWHFCLYFLCSKHLKLILRKSRTGTSITRVSTDLTVNSFLAVLCTERVT